MMNEEPSIIAPSSHGLVAPDQRGAHGSAQVVMVEYRSLPLMVALALVAGVALGISLWTVYASRETRMLEYYVIELDGKLMASGLTDYNESWAARKAARKKQEQQK